MADLHFLRPYWLLAIIPALLLFLGFVKRKDSVARWREVIDPHLLEHLLVGEHKKNWFNPINLLFTCWIFAVIALAGPTWQKESSPFLDDQAGLLILLKVSKTMEAKDVQPSRIERAKQKLRDILELRKGGATGLIVYSGTAHLVMPLTRDDRIIQTMVQDITPAIMPEDGDAFSAAVVLAEELVKQTGAPGSLLVLADSVSHSQLSALKSVNVSLPVQFISMTPQNREVDTGILGAADVLGGSVTQLSVDSADVSTANQRAKTNFSSVAEQDGSERWRDGGYMLLPAIALCMLLWFRKGWVAK